jgi:formylglycine-generating enzyme required for sulfatase activity
MSLSPGLHPLADGLPEPWAVEWGEDRFGVFESFAVGEVVQRMRWVPPGRFVMGSPAGEAGRHHDEEQHEVELTRGYLLGDTPVTQALWQAVMGANPSRDPRADRPVEQVSWEDCQEFLARLNERLPGLGGTARTRTWTARSRES